MCISERFGRRLSQTQTNRRTFGRFGAWAIGSKRPGMMRSLRVRLTVVFGGLTLLAVLVFALVVAGVLERLLIENLGHDLEVQAYLVADRVAADLASGDVAAVQAVL